MQDYLGLGSEARMNTPGSTHNNWRWRIRAEDLNDDWGGQMADIISAAGRGSTAK